MLSEEEADDFNKVLAAAAAAVGFLTLHQQKPFVDLTLLHYKKPWQFKMQQRNETAIRYQQERA